MLLTMTFVAQEGVGVAFDCRATGSCPWSLWEYVFFTGFLGGILLLVVGLRWLLEFFADRIPWSFLTWWVPIGAMLASGLAELLLYIPGAQDSAIVIMLVLAACPAGFAVWPWLSPLELPGALVTIVASWVSWRLTIGVLHWLAFARRPVFLRLTPPD